MSGTFVVKKAKRGALWVMLAVFVPHWTSDFYKYRGKGGDLVIGER